MNKIQCDTSNGMFNFTWSSLETTSVEELQSEMDINITKKHQDIAFLPGTGSNIQTTATRKLFINRDQSIIGKSLFPEKQDMMYLNLI